MEMKTSNLWAGLEAAAFFFFLQLEPRRLTADTA